jgi:nicotinamide-nucleotide amidase
MADGDRRRRSGKCQIVAVPPAASGAVAIMPDVRATILAVGSELLSTERLDSNSLRLTALLELHGVELVKKSVVGDLAGEIVREIRGLLEASDLVLVSGGLGPTADDLTREAAAAALGVELVADPEIQRKIERRFAAMGRQASPNNRKQADVLAGAVALDNPHGSAPGQLFERDGKALFLFPGVPFELDAMAAEALVPWLEAHAGQAARETRTIKVAMRPESEVDQALAAVYEEFGGEWITVLAGAGEVRIQLTAVGVEGDRRSRLDAMRARTLAALGEGVFGEGAETTLESVVVGQLAAGGWTLAAAESCTGGLVCERITRIAGSSRVFLGGVVAYADEAKRRFLDVEQALLQREGAVSEGVARAMASGVRSRFATDFGVGITGIAGPGGGSAEKPVGSVHLAVAGPGDSDVEHRFARFPGNRERIRIFASQMALEMLRRRLNGALASRGGEPAGAGSPGAADLPAAGAAR